MVSHNNVIPNVHFKKKWQFRVKTWFNQPARKTRRRKARAEKAKNMFPRPISKLRPVVRACSIRYNTKLRYGKGFSLDELKQAGINPKLAPTIGIAVDHRRKNLSEEGLQVNVQRLKAYKSNLVLFPRNAKKVKEGEASAEERSKVAQVIGTVMPITHEKPKLEFVTITQDMKDFKAYGKLRIERTNKRLKGKREKRLVEQEAEEKDKMK